MSYIYFGKMSREKFPQRNSLSRRGAYGRHTEGETILNDMLQTCSRGERWGDRNHEELLRFNEEWGILKQRGEDLNMKATLSGIQKEINQIRSVNIRSCMWLKARQEVTPGVLICT